MVSGLLVAVVSNTPCEDSLHTIFGGIFDTTGCAQANTHFNDLIGNSWEHWSAKEQQLFVGSLLGIIGILILLTRVLIINCLFQIIKI